MGLTEKVLEAPRASNAEAIRGARVGRVASPALGFLLSILPYVALVAFAALLLRRAPINRSLLPAAGPGSDLLVSHWPAARAIQELFSGDPYSILWNPFYGGGRPLAADPLAALFYPPTQLLHLLAARDYFMLILVGHLALAGVGTYLLARHALRLSPVASLVGAIAFMGTPRLIAHLGAGHITMIQTVAWYPWVALASWATVRDPVRWSVPLAGLFALMLLSGHPQMAYYGSMMLVASAVWLLLVRLFRQGGRATLLSIAGLGVGAILGAMLAAVHLLPASQFTANSTREETFQTGDSGPLSDVVGTILGQPLPSPVPHEMHNDPGMVVLILAVVGLLTRWRVGIPLAVGVALVATLMMGWASPTFELAAEVLPEYSRFRGVARIWFVGLLGVALLAALGTDSLMRGARRLSGVGAALVGLICLLLVSGTLVWMNRGLAAVDEIEPLTATGEIEQRAAELAGSGRIYDVQRRMSQINAVNLGVEIAHGQDPLLIEPYASFMQRAGGYQAEGYQLAIPAFGTEFDGQPDAGLLGLVDVEIVLSETDLQDSRFELLEQIGATGIYRNTANAGRVYLIEAPADGSPPSIDDIEIIEDAVAGIENDQGRIRAQVDALGEAFVVIGSPYYPGWTAQVDGQSVDLETVDGVLPAIRLGAGEHSIDYRYEPATVQWGGVLSLTGAVLGIGWMLGIVIVRRRRGA